MEEDVLNYESIQDETSHPAERVRIPQDVIRIEFGINAVMWIQVRTMIDEQVDSILFLFERPVRRVV